MSHTARRTSRWSQSPFALAVPPSPFTLQVGGGSGYDLGQERTERLHARENERKARMKIDGSHLFWTVFAPEADERRFLAGLSVSMFLIIPMWGRGLLQFMGPNPVLASLVVGWIGYMLKFRKRLRHRGELGRVIIAPAAFFALLLGVSLL